MGERGRPRSFDRAAALRRAMEVFWEKGYDGTSMSDLTAAMAINSPSIYAAFGCKEQLFREAVELYSTTDGGRIWSAMIAAPTARGAIEAMLRTTAQEFTRPGRPRGCLVVLSAIHVGEGNEAICLDLRQQRLQNIEQLVQRLDRGIADGELPKSIDRRAIATFYATVQHGMSIQARDGVSRKALLTVADSAMAAWEGLTSPRTVKI
jgi:AcrR family transcriptional regulator